MACLRAALPWLLLAPALAHAQAKIYICKDAAGRTLTSDRPIAECSNRPVREVDKSGITRREIPAPLTPEERQQQAREEAARRAEQLAAQERRHGDRALLARFRSEDEIISSSQRNIVLVQENVKRETLLLTAAEKRQQAAEDELALSMRKQQTSHDLRQRLQDADHAVAASRRRLGDYEAEILLINSRTDAMLKRFRELQQEKTAQQ
ncbi:MAG TPA: DUF4124 domain-containing protein [Noviherbaspirillum sp.]